MSSDVLKNMRKKSRLIMELRYPPLVQAFDRRGLVLSQIHAKFAKKLERWRAQNIEITMADSFDTPSKLMHINHLRCSVDYEDACTFQEFIDDTKNYLKYFYEVFPELQHLKRIGVRSISVFKDDKAKSYDDIFTKITKSYLNPNIPLQLKFNDCRISLTHANGLINLGPTKHDDPWIKDVFTSPTVNVPEYGLGVDIDGFTNDLKITNEKELLKAFSAVMEATVSFEEDIFHSVFRENS